MGQLTSSDQMVVHRKDNLKYIQVRYNSTIQANNK